MKIFADIDGERYLRVRQMCVCGMSTGSHSCNESEFEPLSEKFPFGVLEKIFQNLENNWAL